MLFGLRAVAQIPTIKVKKELTQADAPWNVTLCGMYRGNVKVEDICKNNQLKIAYNTIGLRIIRFDITFKSNDKIYNWSTTGDTISAEIRSRLMLVDKKAKVFIDDIKAVSKNNDTIYLNPITLRVIE